MQADLNAAVAGAMQGKVYAAPGAGQGAGEGSGIARSGERPLPGCVGRIGPVLKAASAARTEVRAGWLDPVWAGTEPLGRTEPAVAVLSKWRRLRSLARQHERQVSGLFVRESRHAVAVKADALDGDDLRWWRGVSRTR